MWLMLLPFIRCIGVEYNEELAERARGRVKVWLVDYIQ